jgi:tetratricopeptide (TPR) repeat protein
LYGIYRGEYAKATEFLEKAVAKCEKAEARYNQIYLSVALAWIYIESDRLREANDLIDKIDKFATETSDTFLTTWTEMVKGMWFRAQKRWEESIENFEKIREYWYTYLRRWMIYIFAKCYLDEYARVFIERNQEGDREKALDLLRQSLEIYQKLGAKKETERTMKRVEAIERPSTHIDEEAVSRGSYESLDVHANISATPRELKIGESLELEIEVTNTRKEGTVLLTKITEAIPEGFAISKKPESYRVEDNCLNMKEKQLDPLKKEEVKLVLTPKVQGTFQIKPRILYLDANGKEKTYEPKPVSIVVKELGIKGWLKGER